MTFEEAIQFNIDQLTLGFRSLRDKIKDQQSDFDEGLKPSKEQLEVLRSALAKKLLDMGANSVNTPHGTPYFSTTTKATVEDWEAFYAFVEEVQDSDLLVKQVNKTKAEEYAEQMGKPVPGVKLTPVQTLNVRS